VPCDLSLITIRVSNCRLFSDINISQGNIATHLRCGGITQLQISTDLASERILKIRQNLTELPPWVWMSTFLEHSVYWKQCKTATLQLQTNSKQYMT